MLEYLVIFSRGGAVLWTVGQLLHVKGSPINTFVSHCLLEDRGGDKSYVYRPSSGEPYTLKWVLDNSRDLVFVAVYQQMLTVRYVEALLQSLQREFASVYQPGVYAYPEFTVQYRKIRDRLEKLNMTSKQRQQGRSNGSVTKNGARRSNGEHALDQIQEGADDDDTSESSDTQLRESSEPTRSLTPSQRQPTGSGKGSTAETSLHGSIEVVGAHIAQNGAEGSTATGFDREALQKKVGGKGPGGRKASGPRQSARNPAAAAQTKIGKKPRKWGKDVDAEALDFSAPPATSEDTEAALDPTRAAAQQSRMDTTEAVTYDDDDHELEAELSNGHDAGKSDQKGLLTGLLSSLKTSVVGKQALSADDVAAAVAVMQKRLQERNVSSEVATQVCASVSATLEGRKLASFTGVASLVRTAMESAITRILSPKRSIDVLTAIRASQSRGVPYSIVFVGVNGVGKSTNLAKIAYWLRQQDLRVMIAACDTFRSGAVEQLKTHCNRLGVPLFDRGYDKDPTNVAAEAIKQAKRDGIDVVLVDTAGRMQDNEPLMHALSMLINKNSPDLVLFVGEALVGNDGVNQLVKFNQRLADLSPLGKEPRLIDGILVTKFDAIDNKVGAVLSMAYSSGAPIMFVGCGQTYVDLMRLDVRAVVKSLLR